MRITGFFMSVAMGLLLVTGCEAPRVVVATGCRFTNATYAIDSFADGYSHEHRSAYPEAAAATATAFETALKETGCQFVPLGHEDITVSGVVTAYFQGWEVLPWGKTCTTVGFDVKAVSRKTGVVLWKASHTTSATPYYYDLPPPEVAEVTARKIVKQLRQEVLAP